MEREIKKTRLIAELAIFVAIGVVIWVIEEFIPQPFPYVKIGLANIITMIVLFCYGLKAAFTVGLVRIVLASLLIGKFLTPPFFLSLTGFIFAICGIVSLYALFGPNISIVGLSIGGAFFHNVGQIIAAYLLIVQKVELFYLLPYFSIAALVTGAFIGFMAAIVIKTIFKPWLSKSAL